MRQAGYRHTVTRSASATKKKAKEERKRRTPETGKPCGIYPVGEMLQARHGMSLLA
jgi:hypothetical protein